MLHSTCHSAPATSTWWTRLASASGAASAPASPTCSPPSCASARPRWSRRSGDRLPLDLALPRARRGWAAHGVHGRAPGLGGAVSTAQQDRCQRRRGSGTAATHRLLPQGPGQVVGWHADPQPRHGTASACAHGGRPRPPAPRYPENVRSGAAAGWRWRAPLRGSRARARPFGGSYAHL